jgi:hypothetical protein
MCSTDLCIEDTAEVGPGHGEVRPRLDSFQVAGLVVGFVDSF